MEVEYQPCNKKRCYVGELVVMGSELVSRGSPHVACDGLGLGLVSRS